MHSLSDGHKNKLSKHLTGLHSNLNDYDFYKNCISGKIDIGNIHTDQKYNWSTLKTKGNHIEKVHELLYKDGQKILVSEFLDTNFVFPYAVKNIANNMCIGFVSNINKARSLRKASTSIKSNAEKSIIAIFAKTLDAPLYHELVYVSNVLGLYEKDDSLLDKLNEPIQLKFLEIITRPG